MRKGRTFIISGPSGVGKSTVSRELAIAIRTAHIERDLTEYVPKVCLCDFDFEASDIAVLMGLNPTVYAKALGLADREDRASRLENAKINLCMECGCCSFVCPAKRPLVENNRLAKSDLRAYQAAHANKEKGEEKK